MADAGSLPYRPCAGMMLFNADGLVFVGQRRDQMVEAWQMPQGGIDPGEGPEQAARRELREEVGTDQVTLLGQTRDWLYYDLPPDLLGKVWGGKYRGQKMLWFAFRLDGGDALIDINTAHPEFKSWRWSPVGHLIDYAVPFKRDIYKTVVAELGGLG